MTVRISRDVYDKLVDIAIKRDCTLYEAWDFFFKQIQKKDEKVKTKTVYKEPMGYKEPYEVLRETHGKAPSGKKNFVAWLYDHGYMVVKKGDGG